MTRINKQTDIELDTFSPSDGARLLAFNITKQRIADRANAMQFSLPSGCPTSSRRVPG